MKLRVVVERDEDGIFVAEVPQLPGCITQGTTHDEAVRNAREAAQRAVPLLAGAAPRIVDLVVRLAL